MQLDREKSDRLSRLVRASCRRDHPARQELVLLLGFAVPVRGGGTGWRLEDARRAVDALGGYFGLPPAVIWSHVFEAAPLPDVGADGDARHDHPAGERQLGSTSYRPAGPPRGPAAG